MRAASQNQWRLWSRVLPVEARLQRFGGRHPPPPRAGRGRRRSTPRPCARAGDMTREEDEERSAARAAERMLDRREGGSPYRSEVDDVRRDLRGLVQQLNERLNDGTRVALSRGPTPDLHFAGAQFRQRGRAAPARMAGDPAGAPGSARVHAAGRGLAGRPGPVAVAGGGFPGTSRVRSRAWPMPPTAWPPDSRNAWIRPVRPRPGRWASVSTPCWTRWPNRIPCGARCWPDCRMT